MKVTSPTVCRTKRSDAGVVSLHDDISVWYPEFVRPLNRLDYVLSSMSLWQLATFTSGLPREACVELSPEVYAAGIVLGNNASLILNCTAGEMLIMSQQGVPMYSNLDFELLGWTLERAVQAHTSYPNLSGYFLARVAQPLGMTSTGFEGPGAVAARTAWPVTSPDWRAVDLGWSVFCGGMYSTADDMAKLARLFATGGDGSVVSPATIREYLRPHTALPDGVSSWGLG